MRVGEPFSPLALSPVRGAPSSTIRPVRHPGRWLFITSCVACACRNTGPVGAPPASALGPAAPPSASLAPIPAGAPVTSDPDVPSGAAAARDRELAQKASAFIDVFVNTQPVFSRDGKRVIFTSDRDGLPQLYVADATRQGGPATRIAKTDERTLKEVARHVEAKPGWIEPSRVLASRKGNLVGINVLAGDHFEVRLLDGTTLAPKVEVKTPLGRAGCTTSAMMDATRRSAGPRPTRRTMLTTSMSRPGRWLLCAATRARGIPVEYMVAENAGHSLDRRETRAALYARAARFLETNVAAK